MKKLLFVQTTLQPPGGANTVTAWMLEALREEHHVTILTWKSVDFASINRYYGTNLRDSDFTVICVNRLIRKLIELDPDPGSIQKISYLQRMCKKIAGDYDLVLSSDLECDFGRRGIQYVHYPQLSHVYDPVATGDVRFFQGIAALLSGKMRPWMFLGKYSFDRMKQNLMLANSDWTGRLLKRTYGVETTTVYPPAPGQFDDLPWDQRTDSFVTVGRFHPGKRFELIVQILSEVRMSFPALKLHVIGGPDLSVEGTYADSIRQLPEKYETWISVHENIARPDLVGLLGQSRYGIHAQVDEHFGIAPAEMLRAGCIPFVHQSGGQVEIVGEDPRLTYANQAEAASKIVSIMQNRQQQDELRGQLRERAVLFTTNEFKKQIMQAVDRCFKGENPHRSSTPIAAVVGA